MKFYLNVIKRIQALLLAVSIGVLVALPQLILFMPGFVDETLLYAFSHFSLFGVMVIRPLADLLPRLKFVRPLVILRKGVGVFSASIIVSFMLAKLMIDPGGYLASMVSADYWSLDGLAFFAHIADIAAVILLVTSNNLSKKLLGAWWKLIQKLSYVYFYGSAIYLLFTLGNLTMIFHIAVVTLLTSLAYIKNYQVASESVTKINPTTI